MEIRYFSFSSRKLSLTEQKLLYTIKKEVKDLNKEQNLNKYIYVIHNLKEYKTVKDVNDYIENTLKKLCKIELEETNQLNILNDNNLNDEKYFTKYYTEKGENVAHFIFVNESGDDNNSEDNQISKYFNEPTIKYLQKEMEVIKTRNKFSVIEDCKDFLIKIHENIMEESIKKENLVTIEGDNCDKIVLKNTNDINLKSYAINEVLRTFRNNGDDINYSCYIDLNMNKLYIHIELPGGGKIQKKFTVKEMYNIFTFLGTKNGDIDLEEDAKNDIKKFKKYQNNRKTIKFKFNIPIPCSDIQVQAEEGKQLSKVGKRIKYFVPKDKDSKDKDIKDNNDSKGLITFEYNVIVLNQKKETTDEDIIDF